MYGIPFRILVAEDDADDRFILDEAFKEIGYEAEVKKFVDGEALLSYLRNIDPSLLPALVVLDNSLPKMDVSELLSLLKKDQVFCNIKVVIYTTLVSPERKQLLLSLGADACITKGTHMSEIVAVARKLKAVAEGNMVDNDLNTPYS